MEASAERAISIDGDACAAVLTCAQMLGPLEMLPEDLSRDELRRDLVAFLNDRALPFQATLLERQRAYLAGQGTNFVAAFEDAVIGLECIDARVRDGFREALERHLGREAVEGLEVASIHGILFRTGLLSVRVLMRLREGWRGDAVLRVLGEGARDAIASACSEMFPTALNSFKDGFAQCLRRRDGRKLERVASAIESRALSFPSIHIVYGGHAKACDGRIDFLDESYRRIFYMTSAARIGSHSPHPNEFVRFGYAFSLVACAEEVETRVHEAALCVRIMHMLFYQLVGLCEFIETQSGDNCLLTSEQAKLARRGIVQSINRLRSGVYTYRHEMIVFQDRIYESWFLDRLVSRARDALQLLVDEREQVERRQQRQRDLALAALLAVIAVLSLVSVVADSMQIVSSFGG